MHRTREYSGAPVLRNTERQESSIRIPVLRSTSSSPSVAGIPVFRTTQKAARRTRAAEYSGTPVFRRNVSLVEIGARASPKFVASIFPSTAVRKARLSLPLPSHLRVALFATERPLTRLVASGTAAVLLTRRQNVVEGREYSGTPEHRQLGRSAASSSPPVFRKTRQQSLSARAIAPRLYSGAPEYSKKVDHPFSPPELRDSGRLENQTPEQYSSGAPEHSIWKSAAALPYSGIPEHRSTRAQLLVTVGEKPW